MRRIAFVSAGLILAFLAVACAQKFTGGGTIPSQGDQNQRAEFEFVYKVENSNGSGKAKGFYHDVYAVIGQTPVPLRFKFDGALSSQPAGSNCIDGILNYISQEKRFPGSGTVRVEACDNGEPSGPSNGDTLTLTVQSGPYSGYSNSGTVKGNFQAHN
jgi:hypothetical protein